MKRIYSLLLASIMLIPAMPFHTPAQQATKTNDASRQSRKVASLIGALKAARVIELNFVWTRDSPLLGLNPPYSLGLHTSHKQTKGLIPGGIAFAADMMFFSGQHGSPTIDALGHISNNMKLHGGADAAANEDANGLLTLGIEAYPKERFVNRAVLLDEIGRAHV